MKQPKDIEELIIAVLRGTASKEEQWSFQEWINESHENEIQFEYLKKIWKERSSEVKFFHSDEIEEEIWQKGVNAKDTRQVKNLKRLDQFHFVRVAAVIAIFIAAAYVMYLFQDDTSPKLKPVAVEIISKDNPAGQKTMINLPDGSVVWLNSLSSIDYPKFFSDSLRSLKLSGEAYFEVKKDSLRPFTVRSEGLITTAIGTSFNIKAYPEENDVNVGLITGKISVKEVETEREIVLNLNQGAIYNKLRKDFKEIDIDPEKILAWKNGILRFEGENFQEFIDKLEQWYGVEIIIVGEAPKNWNIRGEFEDEYLTNILTSISFNKEFNYNINRKEVILTFK